MGFFDSIAGVQQQVASLTDAANKGFTVSDEGGQALINAIKTLDSELAGYQKTVNYLSAELPIGTSPGGQLYKPFLASIASDPREGLGQALAILRQELAAAEAAITRSMASYQASDHGSAQGITAAGDGTVLN
jgi:multidrug resistance efflux pump